MPRVTIHMFEGRSKEQKRAAAEQITRALCETCDVKAENVSILFEDITTDNYAKGGKLMSDL